MFRTPQDEIYTRSDLFWQIPCTSMNSQSVYKLILILYIIIFMSIYILKTRLIMPNLTDIQHYFLQLAAFGEPSKVRGLPHILVYFWCSVTTKDDVHTMSSNYRVQKLIWSAHYNMGLGLAPCRGRESAVVVTYKRSLSFSLSLQGLLQKLSLSISLLPPNDDGRRQDEIFRWTTPKWGVWSYWLRAGGAS